MLKSTQKWHLCGHDYRFQKMTFVHAIQLKKAHFWDSVTTNTNTKHTIHQTKLINQNVKYTKWTLFVWDPVVCFDSSLLVDKFTENSSKYSLLECELLWLVSLSLPSLLSNELSVWQELQFVFIVLVDSNISLPNSSNCCVNICSDFVFNSLSLLCLLLRIVWIKGEQTNNINNAPHARNAIIVISLLLLFEILSNFYCELAVTRYRRRHILKSTPAKWEETLWDHTSKSHTTDCTLTFNILE